MEDKELSLLGKVTLWIFGHFYEILLIVFIYWQSKSLEKTSATLVSILALFMALSFCFTYRLIKEVAEAIIKSQEEKLEKIMDGIEKLIEKQ